MRGKVRAPTVLKRATSHQSQTQIIPFPAANHDSSGDKIFYGIRKKKLKVYSGEKIRKKKSYEKD